jgi:hypothetical protein
MIRGDLGECVSARPFKEDGAIALMLFHRGGEVGSLSVLQVARDSKSRGLSSSGAPVFDEDADPPATIGKQ